MIQEKKYDMATILGATASGKTALAARVAIRIEGEVISADSRQVYRGMDLGTGKDYEDYVVEGKKIPYHLIDILDPGAQYNVFEYQQDFLKIYKDLKFRQRFPILCGGSGMYLESVLNGYDLKPVPPNVELRETLKDKSLEQLTEMLKALKPQLHNTTDIDTSKRAIRAIEIEEFYRENRHAIQDFPRIHSLVVGVKYDRLSRRKRITQRLKQRLDDGMVEEVKKLLLQGVSEEELIYYGLEYKYLTLYVAGKLSYKEMFEKLNVAIHQFAKRQMTWFRKMERNGTPIHWLDGYMPMDEKVEKVLQWLK